MILSFFFQRCSRKLFFGLLGITLASENSVHGSFPTESIQTMENFIHEKYFSHSQSDSKQISEQVSVELTKKSTQKQPKLSSRLAIDYIQNSLFAPHRRLAKSNEWQSLPPQNWERQQMPNPIVKENAGISPQAVQRYKIKNGFHLKRFIQDTPIAPTAIITSGNEDSLIFTPGNKVILKRPEEVSEDFSLPEVGEKFAITQYNPLKVEVNTEDNKEGFVYPIYGELEILESIDSDGDTIVGKILWSNDAIQRGHVIIPALPRVSNIKLTPGQSELSAVSIDLGVDGYQSRNLKGLHAAQHSFIGISAGSDDGIEPGMIFRAYKTTDEVTGEQYAPHSLTMERLSDILIVHTAGSFSTGLVIRSKSPLEPFTPLTLLTDLSDLYLSEQTSKPSSGKFSSEGSESEDDLDALDNGEELIEPDTTELEQLENYPTDESEPLEAEETTDYTDEISEEEGDLPPPPEDDENSEGDGLDADSIPNEEDLPPPPEDDENLPAPPDED